MGPNKNKEMERMMARIAELEAENKKIKEEKKMIEERKIETYKRDMGLRYDGNKIKLGNEQAHNGNCLTAIELSADPQIIDDIYGCSVSAITRFKNDENMINIINMRGTIAMRPCQEGNEEFFDMIQEILALFKTPQSKPQSGAFEKNGSLKTPYDEIVEEYQRLMLLPTPPSSRPSSLASSRASSISSSRNLSSQLSRDPSPTEQRGRSPPKDLACNWRSGSRAHEAKSWR